MNQGQTTKIEGLLSMHCSLDFYLYWQLSELAGRLWKQFAWPYTGTRTQSRFSRTTTTPVQVGRQQLLVKQQPTSHRLHKLLMPWCNSYVTFLVETKTLEVVRNLGNVQRELELQILRSSV